MAAEALKNKEDGIKTIEDAKYKIGSESFLEYLEEQEFSKDDLMSALDLPEKFDNTTFFEKLSSKWLDAHKQAAAAAEKEKAAIAAAAQKELELDKEWADRVAKDDCYWDSRDYRYINKDQNPCDPLPQRRPGR